MKVTSKGQITIPRALRQLHGLTPKCEVEVVDQPGGVLIIKARKLSRGKRVLALMLKGRISGRTEQWLQTTRGDTA